MSSEWQPLAAVPQNEEAPLLAKCVFTSNSYSVQVTDLCSVWSESLQEQGIVKRARELRCSLDPEDQLQKFLEKLKGALRGGEGTQIKVDWSPGRGQLTLSSSSPLPKPLSPLNWSMNLSRLPDIAIKNEVILPLMGLAYVQKQQAKELEALLGEKDSAIGKIVDKVEGLGIDLSNVFPQTGASRSSKKKSQREHVLKQVRGLAPFDSEAWKAESGSALQSASHFGEVACAAFSGSGSAKVQSIAQNIRLVGPKEGGDSREVPLAQRSRDDTGQDSQQDSKLDGFQRQTTPPDRKHPDLADQTGQSRNGSTDQTREDLPAIKEEVDDDETTEDEAEAEIREADLGKSPSASIQEQGRTPVKSTHPAQAVRPPTSESQPAPSPRKLGVIGKAKTPTKSTETSKQRVSPDQQDDDHDSDDLNVAVVKGSNNKETPAAPPKAPRKLGKIGGGKPKQDDHPAPALPHIESNTDSQNHAEEQAKNHSKTMETQQKGLSTEPTRKDPATPVIEESAEAKADRKRSELKREMEEKGNKSAPKKKRRF